MRAHCSTQLTPVHIESRTPSAGRAGRGQTVARFARLEKKREGERVSGAPWRKADPLTALSPSLFHPFSRSLLALSLLAVFLSCFSCFSWFHFFHRHGDTEADDVVAVLRAEAVAAGGAAAVAAEGVGAAAQHAGA